MSSALNVILRNSQKMRLADIPEYTIPNFRATIIRLSKRSMRLCALFAVPGHSGEFRLYAVLANDAEGALHPLTALISGNTYPSITPECPSAHLFEREIAETWGIVPEGHPWLKPVRFPGSGGTKAVLPGSMPFYQVQGAEIHEVAVGPVHAGVIEPGHFRFQCHGENVLHLEISLGYQHRGIERSLINGPDKQTLHFMETASGDTTIGHALAYCQLIESLAGSTVPLRGLALRGVALELERLANHTGDLGALANDIAFLPTASYCGRIRGDFLNMTALLCGNRFGRNWMVPGGVRYDAGPALCSELIKRLDAAYADVKNAVDLLWSTSSVLDFFEGCGAVSADACRELGLVGPAARACGFERDVRYDHPEGIYRLTQIPVAVCDSGDVYSRAMVRWLEIERSVVFIRDQLQALPDTPVRSVCGQPAPGQFAVSLTEGWRGEICHSAMTGDNGKFVIYKITDPSFHNWSGLAMALRNEQISNFPINNKSFSLSYCGFDL